MPPLLSLNLKLQPGSGYPRRGGVDAGGPGGPGGRGGRGGRSGRGGRDGGCFCGSGGEVVVVVVVGATCLRCGWCDCCGRVCG